MSKLMLSRPLAILLAFALAACIPQPPISEAPTALATVILSETPTVRPTQTALPIATLTSTPRVMATKTVQPTFQVPAGLSAVEHPKSEYVFLVDEALWQIESDPAKEYDLLAHKTIPGCRIDLVPPMGPPLPDAFYQTVIGQFRWSVRQYSETAIYGVEKPAILYLFLDGNQHQACYSAQIQVLSLLIHRTEYAGGPAFVLAPTRARPALADFHCPGGLKPRLRRGDLAYIVADSIFLRHKPDLTAESKYRAFPKHAPVLVEIVDGPVCVEKEYVFWQVSVNPLSEGITQWDGWMAEANADEYYLALLEP